MWYGQQTDEGKAPGYPMGIGQYRSIKPVRVAVDAGEIGDEGDDSSSDDGPSVTADADGTGVPLYRDVL